MRFCVWFVKFVTAIGKILQESHMIELKRDRLHFSFPEVHKQAKLTVELQRTLRIPDDDRTYPLPPGLGNFPLCHVDDHASNVRRAGAVVAA